ncbi:MAG: FtsX-like permease family protein [Planctomycetaceae bacterium]|nr:FtsX-like permease family protein [Planctomycetaceae bacterium]
MYKLLLCWRYLLTRFIAFASIISVMLGVATLIVVNSVMNGFRGEMEERLHGIMSDITIHGGSLDGFQDYQEKMAAIRRVAGDKIVGMTPTVMIPAMLSYKVGGEPLHQQINLVGIDIDTMKSVGDITKFLQHPDNRENPAFVLRQDGYDTYNHLNPKDSAYRPGMGVAGWDYRQKRFAFRDETEWGYDNESIPPVANPTTAAESSARADVPGFMEMMSAAPQYAGHNLTSMQEQQQFNPTRQTHTGAFVGIGLTIYSRRREVDPATNEEKLIERMRVIPGDDIVISFPQMGNPPTFGTANCTIVDIYESRMSDYDTKFVFIPIEKMQELRLMVDPVTKKRAVNQILIKAKPGVNLDDLRDTIQDMPEFPQIFYTVLTWRDQESTLLAAVSMETSLLNLLLFLIIAVAGFGILAIFYMIVLEKMRDIGVMKALGASGFGVMQIFLCYSLALGLAGAGFGTIIGLNIVWNINTIAQVLSYVMGHEVFDPSIYMFSQIPTRLETLMIVKVVGGTLAIAVLSGVLPAIRAARLHPVRALRFE